MWFLLIFYKKYGIIKYKITKKVGVKMETNTATEQVVKNLQACTAKGEPNCAKCTETNWLYCRKHLLQTAAYVIQAQQLEISTQRGAIEAMLGGSPKLTMGDTVYVIEDGANEAACRGCSYWNEADRYPICDRTLSAIMPNNCKRIRAVAVHTSSEWVEINDKLATKRAFWSRKDAERALLRSK